MLINLAAPAAQTQLWCPPLLLLWPVVACRPGSFFWSRAGDNGTVTSSFSQSSGSLVYTATQRRRCQIFPLWDPFSKNIVLGHPQRRCHVDERPKRYNILSFHRKTFPCVRGLMLPKKSICKFYAENMEMQYLLETLFFSFFPLKVIPDSPKQQEMRKLPPTPERLLKEKIVSQPNVCSHTRSSLVTSIGRYFTRKHTVKTKHTLFYGL